MRSSAATLFLGMISVTLLTEAEKTSNNADHESGDQVDEIIQELTEDNRFKDLIEDILDGMKDKTAQEFVEDIEKGNDNNSEKDNDNSGKSNDNNTGKDLKDNKNIDHDERDCVATLESDEEISGIVCTIEITKSEDGNENYRRTKCKSNGKGKNGKKCNNGRTLKIDKTSVKAESKNQEEDSSQEGLSLITKKHDKYIPHRRKTVRN